MVPMRCCLLDMVKKSRNFHGSVYWKSKYKEITKKLEIHELDLFKENELRKKAEKNREIDRTGRIAAEKVIHY